MRPAPERTLRELAEFWEGIDRGVLRVPRCETCGAYRWPPRPRCVTCGGVAFTWTEVAAEGTLYSWTTVGRAFLPDFAEQVPYTVGIVELTHAKPIRMVGRVLGLPADRLEVGMRLVASFEDDGGGTLCHWVQAEGCGIRSTFATHPV